MIRDTFVMRNGKLVPKRLAVSLSANRSGTVSVISDTMAPMKHMATGRIYDSKSRFRADTRATGCVEVGTERPPTQPTQRVDPSMGEIVNDVKRSLQELNSR